MNLRVAGILASPLLFLSGCSAPEGAPLPPNALRVEVGDVAWAAYQDGDGPWQPLPAGATTRIMSPSQPETLSADRARLAHSSLLPNSRAQQLPRPKAATRQLETFQAEEHIVTITDPQGRYGLAYICLDDDPSYGYSDLSIELSTLEAWPEHGIRCYSGEEEPTYILSGTVAGLGAADQGLVYTFFRDPILVDATNTAYGFELWPDLYDVIATRYSGNSTVPNKIVVQNDVSVDADQTLDLDFESASALTPEIYAATITDVTEGLSPSGGVAIASNNFTLASLGGVDQGTTFDYAFIPPEEIGSESDVYVYAEGSNDSGVNVSVTRYLLNPADITVSLPEPLGGVGVAVQGPTPYRFPTATWNAYPGDEAEYGLFYFQYPFEGPSTSAFIDIDESWLGDAATYSYALPDLSAVSGWNNAWNMKAGEEMEWSVNAYVERITTAESPDYISARQSGTLPQPMSPTSKCKCP